MQDGRLIGEKMEVFVIHKVLPVNTLDEMECLCVTGIFVFEPCNRMDWDQAIDRMHMTSLIAIFVDKQWKSARMYAVHACTRCGRLFGQ